MYHKEETESGRAQASRDRTLKLMETLIVSPKTKIQTSFFVLGSTFKSPYCFFKGEVT